MKKFLFGIFLIPSLIFADNSHIPLHFIIWNGSVDISLKGNGLEEGKLYNVNCKFKTPSLHSIEGHTYLFYSNDPFMASASCDTITFNGRAPDNKISKCSYELEAGKDILYESKHVIYIEKDSPYLKIEAFRTDSNQSKTEKFPEVLDVTDCYALLISK